MFHYTTALLGLLLLAIAWFTYVRRKTLAVIESFFKRDMTADESFLKLTSGTGSIALAVRDAIAEALNVEPNLLRPSDSFSRDLSVLPQYHKLDGSNLIPILERRLGIVFDPKMLDEVPDPYSASTEYTIANFISDIERHSQRLEGTSDQMKQS